MSKFFIEIIYRACHIILDYLQGCQNNSLAFSAVFGRNVNTSSAKVLMQGKLF